MKSYYQILVRGQPLKPTQGVPYEFETYQKVLDMVLLCYGIESLKKDVEIVRVNPYIEKK